MEAIKKWTVSKQGWAEIIGQLAIHFDDRISLEIWDWEEKLKFFLEMTRSELCRARDI